MHNSTQGFLWIMTMTVATSTVMSISSTSLNLTDSQNPTSTDSMSRSTGVILTSGQSRAVGYDTIIQSPNRKVQLTTLLTARGTLLIMTKTCRRTTIWTPDTWGQSFPFLTMQLDGNFAIFDLPRPAWKRTGSDLLWHSNTTGHPRAVLTLQDDGELCVFYGGRCVWSNDLHTDTGCGNDCTSVDLPTVGQVRNAATVLEPGQELTTKKPSQNNLVYLQKGKYFDPVDAVAVIRKSDGHMLWRLPNSAAGDPDSLVMEQSGQLTAYGRGGWFSWGSGTYGQEGAVLKVFDDGLLCVAKDDACVWSSELRYNPANCTINPLYVPQE